MEGTAAGPTGADASKTNLALGLAAATVLAMVVLGAADADGPIWIIQGVLAAATVAVALQAGGRSPANPKAFGALLVGGILLLIFLGFLISGG